jgi:hypothetical protein
LVSRDASLSSSSIRFCHTQARENAWETEEERDGREAERLTERERERERGKSGRQRQRAERQTETQGRELHGRTNRVSLDEFLHTREVAASILEVRLQHTNRHKASETTETESVSDTSHKQTNRNCEWGKEGQEERHI